jgi:hypothetical protein
VLPCPAELNLSITKILESGCLLLIWYAVDRPIIPAPTTTASYSVGIAFPYSKIRRVHIYCVLLNHQKDLLESLQIKEYASGVRMNFMMVHNLWV